MARPTKLTKELIKTAIDYVDDCTAFEDVVPTVAGLALAMGISKDTVYEWAAAKNEDGSLKNKEFSDAVSDLKSKQEKELIANGLQSVFNPAITRLMLSSNHGYKEKQDVTSDDKPIAPLLVRFVGDDKYNNGDTTGV